MEIKIIGSEKEIANFVNEIQRQSRSDYKKMHFDKEDVDRLENKFIELFVYCMSLQDEYNKPRIEEIKEGLDRAIAAKNTRYRQAPRSVQEDLFSKSEPSRLEDCSQTKQ